MEAVDKDPAVEDSCHRRVGSSRSSAPQRAAPRSSDYWREAGWSLEEDWGRSLAEGSTDDHISGTLERGGSGPWGSSRAGTQRASSRCPGGSCVQGIADYWQEVKGSTGSRSCRFVPRGSGSREAGGDCRRAPPRCPTSPRAGEAPRMVEGLVGEAAW